jgi:hypothetical protein
MVGWFRLVAVSLVFLLSGIVFADFPLIFHIGMILPVLVHIVIDDLSPAVGELNSVLAFDFIAIALLVLGVDIGISIRVVLFDVVTVGVVFRLLLVEVGFGCVSLSRLIRSRGGVVGGWGVVGGGADGQ